jgi:hypothetical protein
MSKTIYTCYSPYGGEVFWVDSKNLKSFQKDRPNSIFVYKPRNEKIFVKFLENTDHRKPLWITFKKFDDALLSLVKGSENENNWNKN